jgi:hypothetical protein
MFFFNWDISAKQRWCGKTAQGSHVFAHAKKSRCRTLSLTSKQLEQLFLHLRISGVAIKIKIKVTKLSAFGFSLSTL